MAHKYILVALKKVTGFRNYLLFLIFFSTGKLTAQNPYIITAKGSFNLLGKVKSFTEKKINGQIANGQYKNISESSHKTACNFDTSGKATYSKSEFDGVAYYYYNNEGKMTSERREMNGKVKLFSYKYDDRNNLLNALYLCESDSTLTQYEYDNFNNVVKYERSATLTYDGVKNHFFNKEIYYYSGDLLLQKNVFLSKNEIERTIFYSYNSKRKLVSEFSLIPDSSNSIKNIFLYAPDSITLIQESYIDNSRKVIVKKAFLYKDLGKTKIVNEYNTDGSISSTNIDKVDNLNNVVESSYYKNGQLQSKRNFIREYNKRGLLTKLQEIISEAGNTQKRVHLYTYDHNSNLIKEYLIVGNSFVLTERKVVYY